MSTRVATTRDLVGRVITAVDFAEIETHTGVERGIGGLVLDNGRLVRFFVTEHPDAAYYGVQALTEPLRKKKQKHT